MPTAADIYRAHPTQAEIEDVLAQRGVAALGTLNEDGSIHLTYLIYLWEDGRFWLETASSTRKARNIAARGSASLLIQGRAATGRSLMVECEGTARLIEVPEAHAINHRIRAKYVLPDVVDDLDRVWGAFDDVAVEVVPEQWRSWTGSELAAATEADLGRAYAGIWKDD
jgi:PPOX class probable F420-dependent enzyme